MKLALLILSLRRDFPCHLGGTSGRFRTVPARLLLLNAVLEGVAPNHPRLATLKAHVDAAIESLVLLEGRNATLCLGTKTFDAPLAGIMAASPAALPPAVPLGLLAARHIFLLIIEMKDFTLWANLLQGILVLLHAEVEGGGVSGVTAEDL